MNTRPLTVDLVDATRCALAELGYPPHLHARAHARRVLPVP